jgi:hypothetical protein
MLGGSASARWAIVVSGFAPLAQPAVAGAWTQQPGTQQAIVTISREVNDFGEVWRSDGFSEFGLEGGWAANFKFETEMRIGDFAGERSGLRAGVQKSFALGDRASLSVMGSYLGGEALDGPDCEGEGYEARAAIGTSYALGDREGFVNVETAWRSRGDFCGRNLIEAAAGIEVFPNWQVIGKAWSEKGDGARSIKAEATVLHDFGDFSLGLGWREEISGEFKEKGWVLSAWTDF